MSESGRAWGDYYKNGNLTWYDPKWRWDHLMKLGGTEYVTRIAKACCLNHKSRARVLEAGCGTGQYALAFGLLGFQVDAFDYNRDAIKIAQSLLAKVKQANIERQVCFYQDNLLNISLRSNNYDPVFNQAVMEYFLDKRECLVALNEMVRVTKPGGYVAVIVQHTGHPLGRLWRWLGWEGYTDQPPVSRYTCNILAKELKETGLTEVTVDGIYPWKTLFFWPKWYQRWTWSSQLTNILYRRLTAYIPLPRLVRKRFAIQILGIGRKP